MFFSCCEFFIYLIFILHVFAHFVCFVFQFSLRSRTPSLSGSIYSPYSSRKVSSLIFFVWLFIYLFFNVMS